ncbi:MAG TPA: DUF983 domain-containing protein [Candidatus Binatia bacterium]|nr:DUF983 domain-containing protein [Candidatus Binatia bacterium]
MLLNAWRGRCPRCRQGTLFRAWPNQVLPQCPVCALPYFREPGYFVGGMVVTYILALLVIVVVSLVLFFLVPDKGWLTENQKIAAWFIFSIGLTVAFLRFSYSLWISVDYWIEPWAPGQPK